MYQEFHHTHPDTKKCSNFLEDFFHQWEAGATVAAVATRRPKRWADLIAFARKSAGTLLVPVSPTAGEVNNDEEKQWDGCHGKFTQEEKPQLSEKLMSIITHNIINLDVQPTKGTCITIMWYILYQIPTILLITSLHSSKSHEFFSAIPAWRTWQQWLVQICWRRQRFSGLGKGGQKCEPLSLNSIDVQD